MEFQAWIDAHSIDGRSLRAWIRRVQSPIPSDAPEPQAPIRLVELIAPTAPAAPQPSPSRAGVIIRIGACAIELGADFDDEQLRRILRVAKEC